jgi:dTDP-4-amino-4,6-dideoxygalactose transaminase
LFLTLLALGVRAGSRVAVPTYACSALLDAVRLAQAEPVVVDVSPDDLNLDPEMLTASVKRSGRRVDATILVHMFGARGAVERLQHVGGEIVEDCCQSLGGALGAELLGSRGRAAVFSLSASKVITCGHGGMIWDRVGTVASAASDLQNYDGRARYVPRFNFQLTDIQAAMARSQLTRLTTIADRRRLIARRYVDSLPPGIDAPVGVMDAGRMVYRFVIRTHSSQHQAALHAHFDSLGITTIIPVERFELLHRYLGLDPVNYPVAETAVDTTLSIPVFPGLTDSEIDRICAGLACAPV